MKKLKKDVKTFVGTGMLIGVGGMATGALGVGGAGMGAMGGMMGPIGTTLGATHVMRLTKKIKPKRKRSHF